MSEYTEATENLPDCADVYSAGFRSGKENLGKFSAPPPHVEAAAALHAAWWKGWYDGSAEAADGWSKRVLERFGATGRIHTPCEG